MLCYAILSYLSLTSLSLSLSLFLSLSLHDLHVDVLVYAKDADA